MAENEPRTERPWVSRGGGGGGGGGGGRGRSARNVLILVFVVVSVATNGFGALPENPLSRSMAEMLGENLPPVVLEPFNEMLSGISQPVIQGGEDVLETENEAATSTLAAVASPSPLATETATPTLEASASPTAAETPTPTRTETPVPTLSPTFSGFPATVNVAIMYLYLGPAIDHLQVQCAQGIYCSYPQGTSASIVGRNAAVGQIWYLVTMPDGMEGWALSRWLLASVDPASIPLIANVPTPPPTPEPTEPEPPTPTATVIVVLFDHSGGSSLTLRSLPVTMAKEHSTSRLFTVLLALCLLAVLLFVGWEEAGKMQFSHLHPRAVLASENHGRADAPPPPASGHDPDP